MLEPPSLEGPPCAVTQGCVPTRSGDTAVTQLLALELC